MNATTLSRDEQQARQRKWLVLAVVISLALHFLVYEWAGTRKIRGPAFYDDLLGRAFKVQRVEMEPPKPLPIPRDVTREPGTRLQAVETSLSSPPPLPEIRKQPATAAPPPAASAIKLAEKKPPAPGVNLPEARRDPKAEAQRRDEVLAIQKEFLKENIEARKRPLRESPGATPADRSDLPEPSGRGEKMPDALAGGTGPDIPAAPGTGARLASPDAGGDSGTGVLLPPAMPLPEVEMAKRIPLRAGDHVLREDISGKRPYEQLNRWMDINLFTYEELRSGKKEGWFMLVITAKENNILKVIPKDVYFVVDSSSSIGSSRLYEFKSGVNASLKDLNANDRFNLLTFKKKPQTFAKSFESFTPASTVNLKKFLSDVYSEGRTDLFRALFPMTALPREENRMRMAILMSDGLATEGERNATRIINQFTERNRRTTSLFALGGGREVNEFILDFLAYQNQGLSLDVKDESRIGYDFHRFYLNVRDPLLMDLDFKFAGIQPGEVYPRNLPHIYQNTPLKIYGRYDPETEKLFSMQILGNSFGSTKELLARQAFEDAKKGTRQIALDWGRQKTYHLIGLTLQHDSPELQAEIRRVSDEYGVDVSFLK